jgi:cell division protein FtsX
MTKFLRGLFAALRGAGLIGIVVLFLHVEWRFVHGNFYNFFKPLVQLFVVGSCFILPLFWILVGITVASHFGMRAMRKNLGDELHG